MTVATPPTGDNELTTNEGSGIRSMYRIDRRSGPDSPACHRKFLGQIGSVDRRFVVRSKDRDIPAEVRAAEALSRSKAGRSATTSEVVGRLKKDWASDIKSYD